MHTHHEQYGILFLNIADRFDNPTRDADEITDHQAIVRIVGEIVDLFDSIDRSEDEITTNLDGAGLVVDHTNLEDDHYPRNTRSTGTPRRHAATTARLRDEPADTKLESQYEPDVGRYGPRDEHSR